MTKTSKKIIPATDLPDDLDEIVADCQNPKCKAELDEPWAFCPKCRSNTNLRPGYFVEGEGE